MIHIDCVQGTSEWARVRAGVATSSQLHRVLTPKTMKLSAQAEGYALELLYEQLTGDPYDNATSGFMQRGSVMERKAVQFYELQRDVETVPAGFVLRDDRRVGSSPDRFIGNDGLAEFKCPSGPNHLGYLLDDEGIGYKVQVQSQLWICEREFCDTVSYNPSMPAAIVRQYRDEKFITALATAVDAFLETVDAMKAKLAGRGLFPELAQGALKIA